MAGALIIAGNPGLNAAYAQQTGTNAQQEVINALKSTATLAIEDPDAFAAIAVDWEGLEDDPIRWFATQTPDIVIEVLTAGAAGGAIGARRGANIAGDLTGAIDDLGDLPPVGRGRPSTGRTDPVTPGEFLDDGGRMVESPLSPGNDFVVRDPLDPGRTITDIDRFEPGRLIEQKSATNAPDIQRWIDKHVVRKVESYLEARDHIPGWEQADIVLEFTELGVDPTFRRLVTEAVQQLDATTPGVTVTVRWP